MVGNLVLPRSAIWAVKRDFWTYILQYTSPHEYFEYGYPHLYAHLQFLFKLERCKPHKATRLPTKCDVINDFKQFPTVYHRIYCSKFLKFPNQMPHYKSKCIKIGFYQSPLILTELSQHNLVKVSYLMACYLYQVMMTLHFLNDVANDTESTQK